jgi:hypothetical protein
MAINATIRINLVIIGIAPDKIITANMQKMYKEVKNKANSMDVIVFINKF